MATAFRSDWWVKTATGQAVVGAHVYWLTQPATVPSVEPVATAAQATDYTDSTASVTTAQPVTTDGLGHASAYLIPGFYTVAIYINGALYTMYPDQNVGEGITLNSLASINSLIGAISLAGGTNVSVNAAGSTVTVSATANLPTLNGLASAVSVTAGSGMTVTPSGSNVQIASTSPALPSNPINFSMMPYNTIGNTAWDQAPYPLKFSMGTATATASTFSNTGYVFQNPQVAGGTASVTAPAFINGKYYSYGATMTVSSASTTTVGYCPYGFDGSNGEFNIMNWLNVVQVHTLNNLVTNARYWWGLSVFWNGSSQGTNNAVSLGTTSYASDTPNKTTIGWRWSNGTDTTIKAVAIIAGASPTRTVVDTGITPDTNPHEYRMVQNFAGTSVFFYIDGSLVATISSPNLPSAVPASNAFDALTNPFICCDNKNTATSVALTYYKCYISWRG